MAEPVISTMLADIVTVIQEALPELDNRVTDYPPEAVPQGLCVWLNYTLAEVELGLLDVVTHTVNVIVAVKRNGNYPGEARIVLDTAQTVRQALERKASSQSNPYFAGEAMPFSIVGSGAAGAGYAGQDDVLVAANIELKLETKTDVQDNP